ncbi:hypothetical protein KKB44_01835 [Candidatus Micrarchaeota archaeon]|nr:hypothetical protein [Candidatus Micrarchaeota archaeon]
MLFIDYLEETAQTLRELTERLQKLDQQYRVCYDRDVRREMSLIKKEIKAKKSEVKHNLLLNLEEFRCLHKYFPDMLQVFMEDEYVGPVLSKKAWLLDFRSVPTKLAAAKLKQLRKWRLQLKDAKKTLVSWIGEVNARAFVATYPVLRGHLQGNLEKDEAMEILDKVDKLLLKEGWLLLISDSLIKIPVTKFMNKIQDLRSKELVAKVEFQRARGKGTVKETEALRKLEKINHKKEHYEKMLTQVLLSNPDYLRSLKKKKHWLSRERYGAFEKFVNTITPHKVKERAWLNEMKKRLEQ